MLSKRECALLCLFTPKKAVVAQKKAILFFMKCFNKTAIQLLYFFGYIKTEENYKEKKDPEHVKYW